MHWRPVYARIKILLLIDNALRNTWLLGTKRILSDAVRTHRSLLRAGLNRFHVQALAMASQDQPDESRMIIMAVCIEFRSVAASAVEQIE